MPAEKSRRTMRSPMTSSTREAAEPPDKACLTLAHRLGSRFDGGHHDHLIARLGHLPCAIRADMNDALAQTVEQRPHAVEHRRIAAGHDGQRGVDGALLTAGNGQRLFLDLGRDFGRLFGGRVGRLGIRLSRRYLAHPAEIRSQGLRRDPARRRAA